MTTQDGGLRPADIETDDTDTVTATEQDVDVEVAHGADVASHSYTGADDDPAAADDVVTMDEEPEAAQRRRPRRPRQECAPRCVAPRATGTSCTLRRLREQGEDEPRDPGTLDVEDYIFQVEVPTEEVTEIKNGQRALVVVVLLGQSRAIRMDSTTSRGALCATFPASPASWGPPPSRRR